jgi:antitoxin ParD1/3/4
VLAAFDFGIMSSRSKSNSVTVGDYFAEFIERQVAQGRYDSASDVVTAGLRLLEEHEAKLEALRAALIEGEQSGAPTPFDIEEFLDEMNNSRVQSK